MARIFLYRNQGNCTPHVGEGGQNVRRGPAVFLLIALLIGIGYGAQRTLTTGWGRLEAFTPSHFQSSRPETGPAPLADRLVLIAVDGLRHEDVTLLPSLDWVRRQGASYRLQVPSHGGASPSAATLLTGAPPELHGHLFAALGRSTAVDSLPGAAVRVQRSAGGAGSAAFGQFVANGWQVPIDQEALVAAAADLTGPSGPQLTILHVEALQRALAEQGYPDRNSPEYKEVLGALDAMLIRLLEPLDLTGTAVMVVGLPATGPLSDSTVPLVMAGTGIRAGPWGTGSLLDVAPTAAALLGTPTPVLAQGRPLMDALAAEGRPADVIMQQYLASRRAFATSALLALGDDQELPEPPETQAESASYLASLGQSLKAARLANWKATILARLPYLGGLALLMVLYLAVALSRRFGGPLFLSLVTYAGAFHLVLYLVDGGYLQALAGLNGVNRSSLALAALKVAGPMVLACLVNGFLLSRQGFRRQSFLGAAALHTALSVAAATALPATVLLLITGWDYAAGLPAAGLVAWFLTAAFQVAVVGYLSPVWVAVTVNAARLSFYLWPLPELGDPVRNADNVVRLRAIRRHSHP